MTRKLDPARGLARHGVKVGVDRLSSSGQFVATVLKQHATDMDADLIVMGGYGHSRVRDFVLGGATDGVLSDLLLPVLLSH